MSQNPQLEVCSKTATYLCTFDKPLLHEKHYKNWIWPPTESKYLTCRTFVFTFLVKVLNWCFEVTKSTYQPFRRPQLPLLTCSLCSSSRLPVMPRLFARSWIFFHGKTIREDWIKFMLSPQKISLCLTSSTNHCLPHLHQRHFSPRWVWRENLQAFFHERLPNVSALIKPLRDRQQLRFHYLHASWLPSSAIIMMAVSFSHT